MENLFVTATPESEGIDSGCVERMVKAFDENGLYMHSFVLWRRGKVLAEGYWKPFKMDMKHRMYSTTKSFVAGAIGLLADEGKIHLDDPVCTYFPEFQEEKLHPFLQKMTIRNLLEMRSPHTTTYSLKKDKWVESFFETEPERPAGTVFRYDTSATYILNVICERIAGKPFIDYMKDKMLREVGFSEDAWCVKSPDGYSWGGSGLQCTTRDLVRFAYILMKKGKVGGKQLLSEAFIEEATSKRTVPTTRNQPINYGYGYQIWKPNEEAFAFNGMGGQIVICYPEKELIFACTADNQGIDYAYKAVYDTVFGDNILKNMHETALPENPAAYESLQKTISRLTLQKPLGKEKSEFMKELNGKTFRMPENPMGIEKVSFSFGETDGVFRYKNQRGEKEIPFGFGEYTEIEFPETHYSGDTIGTPKGTGYRALAVGVWPGEKEFVLRVNIIDDYFGNLTISCGFNGETMGLIMNKTAEGFLEEYVGTATGFEEK